MAGRTRLYQRAKSPLIQGQSKHDRPTWQPWLGATLLAGIIAAPLCVALSLTIRVGAGTGLEVATGDPQRFLLMSATALVVTLPVAAVAAGGSVWLAGRMGWRRKLFGSLLVALAVAVAVGTPVYGLLGGVA